MFAWNENCYTAGGWQTDFATTLSLYVSSYWYRMSLQLISSLQYGTHSHWKHLRSNHTMLVLFRDIWWRSYLMSANDLCFNLHNVLKIQTFLKRLDVHLGVWYRNFNSYFVSRDILQIENFSSIIQFIFNMSCDIWFPTMLHFDRSWLGWACAASL